MIAKLKTLVAGRVAVHGDELYAKASTMLFKTISPSVVVQPKDAEDIATTIRFAAEHKIPLAIRSGGHGTVANRLPEGVLLIDMAMFHDVEVIDKAHGVVRVGSGALWQEVASALHSHNLAISSGDTRTVGVGGLATGGGIGWMIRKYGPVVDTIISAEIVTADGKILRVSETENPDLFWAIRGGGSNFGIVTNFTFQAHHIDGIYIGKITYPLDNAESILKGWRDAMRDAPPELTTMLLVMSGMDKAPASILIHGCFASNDSQAAEAAYAPLLKLDKPTSQEITPAPYKDVLEDGMPIRGIRVIAHAAFIKEFSDEVIHKLCALLTKEVPILQIRHLSGAISKKPNDATAFSHRDCEVLLVHPTFTAPDATDIEVESKLTAWHTIQELSQGEYLNLCSEDTGKEIEHAFPPKTLKRLQQIKAQYDPHNIFNTNYNIKPKP